MRTTIINFKYSHIKNQTADDVLDVYIDGDIVDASTQEFYKNWWGDDTSTSFKSLRDVLLSSSAKRINIHINSGGGMMADAFAMHDFIKENIANGKNWHTYGTGMVASAATFPLVAGLPNNMHISENCFHMMHNASGYIGGSVDEIESYAKTIRKFNDCARDLYADCFGKPKETIANWMNAETWWTGKDMVSMGLISPECCGPEENAITNKISAEKWPFQNMAILNTINSSITKPKNKGMKKNKIANAINEAFAKFFNGTTNLATAKPEDLKTAIIDALNTQEDDEVDPTVITNAVNEAMKGDAFNTAIANGIKKLLETTDNPVNAAITTATNGLAKAADVVNKTDLETLKNDLGDKLGTQKVKNKNGKKPSESEEEDDISNTEGVTWNINKD